MLENAASVSGRKGYRACNAETHMLLMMGSSHWPQLQYSAGADLSLPSLDLRASYAALAGVATYMLW